MDSFASKSWWVFALHGAVAVLFGILAWLWPGITLFWLVVLFAAYALFAGVRLRKTIRNEWLLILTGIVSLVFGVMVLLFPGAGALAMMWLIGFYATFTGVLLLMLAFRMRKLATTNGQQEAPSLVTGKAT